MKAFVLMTAMPPTTGHLQLIRFASQLRHVERVDVLICTQPFEPFPNERVEALRRAVDGNVRILHYDKEIEQDPAAPGFWDMWKAILDSYGVDDHTIVVSSEMYGKQIADLAGAVFMPYDFDRQVNDVRAHWIREDPLEHWDQIIPQFQSYLRTKVTIFGAESTGKTTLSLMVSEDMNAPCLYEYARPYLEHTVNEITPRSMHAIWSGQAALQKQVDWLGTPLVIQDTDLYSTVGYWELPHWAETLGPCPDDLKDEAEKLRSDLYLITPSNILFEPDALRYGGDHREATDDYWINLCKRYHLPYYVLRESPDDRSLGAHHLIKAVMNRKLARLAYDRHGL